MISVHSSNVHLPKQLCLYGAAQPGPIVLIEPLISETGASHRLSQKRSFAALSAVTIWVERNAEL
jgi:hypothetical protein